MDTHFSGFSKIFQRIGKTPSLIWTKGGEMHTHFSGFSKKIFQKIVFDTKRLIYVLKEKFSKQYKLLHIQFDILKVVLWQIFLAIVFVLLLKKCDALLLSYLKLDSVSLDMFKDITIGGMGIAGVILGLYCANISSIFSAKYSTACCIFASVTSLCSTT